MPPPRPAPASKLVLIVEDDQGMQELLDRLLRDEGFRTALAYDGLDLRERLRALKPDAVLLDLMLPRYGGLELLHELRRGETAAIPLIIVTARFTGAKDRTFIIQQPNVAGFFEKPVKPKELLAKLHETLGTEPKKD